MSNYIHDIEKEIIPITSTTCKRILSQEHGGDALTLYVFYAYTAKRQQTNNVRATGTFCRKGLGWGRSRYDRARNILKGLDLIDDITRRDENGQIVGNYVLIKYLMGDFSPVNQQSIHVSDYQQVDLTTSGKTTTNTNKENINTNKENINIGFEVKPDNSRKNKSFPKEDYNIVLDKYQELKGIELKGREFLPIQQAIKTMFLSDRTPNEIIYTMEWLERSTQEWTDNWTINTVKSKLPELVKYMKTKHRKMTDDERDMMLAIERGLI